MKFNVSRFKLHQAASAAIPFVQSRSVIPVFTYFKIETVNSASISISSTNGEVSLSALIPAEVSLDGSICIPAQQFFSFISSLEDGPVSLELNSKIMALEVKAGKSRMSFPGIPGEEFPIMNVPANMEGISPAELQAAANRVAFCASTEEARPQLLCVHFKGLRCEATDSFALATAYFTGLKGALVKAQAVIAAGKIFKNSKSIKGIFENGRVTLADDTIVFQVLCIDSIYPDLTQIIPKSASFKVLVNRKSLLRVIGQALIVSGTDSGHKVNADFKPTHDAEGNPNGEIRIYAQQDGSGDFESVVTAGNYVGKELSLAFNGKYVKSALERAADSDVTIRMNGERLPIEIKDETGWQVIVMPMERAK